MKPERIKPILKWPGGKFRLLGAILPLLPPGKRLVEPFVGSGAVFMNTDYPRYLLADINPDLIGFYRSLADEGKKFIGVCRRLFTAAANAPEAYYRHRQRFNALPRGQAATREQMLRRAALFLYLNRHGYNGLIRYNAGGEFNVPFGRYARPYFPAEEMLAFLEKIENAEVEFIAADFRDILPRVGKGDVAYCDPPYVPLSETANFTSYAGNAFVLAEQVELAGLAEAAGGRDATVVVSNHNSAATRELYRNAREIHEAEVRRFISCNGGKREMARELLAVYP